MTEITQIISISRLFLFQIIIFIKFSCSTDSLSQNAYTGETLKFIQLFQLNSGDLIGSSSNRKIHFSYDKSTNKYIFEKNDSSLDSTIPFYTSKASTKSYKIQNSTSFFLPCVSINHKMFLLYKFNSSNMQSSYFNNGQTPFSEQYNCVINKYLENMFIISYLGLDENYYLRAFIYSYDIESSQFTFLYKSTDYFYYNASASCSYYDLRNYLVCIYVNPVANHINPTLRILKYENQSWTEFYKNILDIKNNFSPIYNVFIQDISNNKSLIVIHLANHKFILLYIAQAQSSFPEITRDYEYRDGDYNNMNFILINDNYFILSFTISKDYSTEESGNFYMYLFRNIKGVIKEINLPKMSMFTSSYSYIIQSRDQYNKLILINQVQGIYLNVYEFDIIECPDMQLFGVYYIQNFDNVNASIHEWYNSTEKKYDNIYISFMNLTNIKNIMEIYSIDSYTYSLSNVKEGINNTYTSQIQYKFLGNNANFKYSKLGNVYGKYEINYVMRRNFEYDPNLIVPSFYCSKFFEFKCYNTCKTCYLPMYSNEVNEDNQQCNECKDGLYPLETSSNIFNCLEKEEKLMNYYFNESNLKFEKCSEMCIFCNEYGDENIGHNCELCIEGYMKLSSLITEDIINEIKNDYGLTLKTNYCTKICNIKKERWYIDISTFEFICLQNVNECPSQYSEYNSTIGRCKFKPLNEYDSLIKKNENYSNNFQSFITGEKNKNIIRDDLLDDVINLIYQKPLIFFNPLHSEIDGQSFKIYFYNISNCSIISSNNSQINLVNFIDNINNYTNSQNIFLALLELSSNENEEITNQVEFSLFDSNGNYINLTNILKESKIQNSNITISKKIKNNSDLINNINLIKKMKNTYQIDLFNISEPFFNEKCLSFYNENDKDMTLNARRNCFQNFSLCSNDCEYTGIDLENLYVNCTCKLNPNMSSKYELKPNKPFDINDQSIYGCFSTIFSKSLFNDAGFYIASTVLASEIIFAFLYYKLYSGVISSKLFINAPPIKKKKSRNQKMKSCKNVPEINKNNIIQFCKIQNDASKNNLCSGENNNNILNKINSNADLRKVNNNLEMSSNKNQINNNNILSVNPSKQKSQSVSLMQVFKSAKDLKHNELPSNSNINISNKEIRKKNLSQKILNLKSREEIKMGVITRNEDEIHININIFGFSCDIKYDAKDLSGMTFISILADKNIMFYLFIKGENKQQIFLRIYTYLSFLCALFGGNAFFYTEKYLDKRLHRKGLYYFVDEYPKIIFAFLLYLLKKGVFRFIKEILPKNKKGVTLLLILANFGVDFLFTFFVIAFCQVYVKSVKNWIINCVITVFLDLFISILCSGLAIFFIDLSWKKKSGFYYIVTEILLLI